MTAILLHYSLGVTVDAHGGAFPLSVNAAIDVVGLESCELNQ